MAIDRTWTETKLGTAYRKIQPKLRMIAKANDDVNAVRAEYACAVRVCPGALTSFVPKGDSLQFRVAGPLEAAALRTPKVKATSRSIEVNVFLNHIGHGKRTPKSIKGVSAVSDDNRLSTATLRLSELADVAELESVAHIEIAESLRPPDANITQEEAPAPTRAARNIPGRDTGGKDVLIGIIDVGGFDFSHEDFLDANGNTRWLRIWDQRGGERPPPGGFDYGSEITKAHMDQAIGGADRVGLPAWALEPQSTMQTSSHGTHVASIAGGNRGVCRNAYLAGVSIALSEEETQNRRRSFYDSTKVAHAVQYLTDYAEVLKAEKGLDDLPVSINISLGTNGGAHDASNGVSRWIDNVLVTPGRAVSVAAGNAGQEAPQDREDIGYINGRIHTSGKIAARGLTSDIEWIVVGNGLSDVSENELEIWYSGSDRFAVSVTPPNMPEIGPINPLEFYQNFKLSDGSFLSVYNELYQPTNGENCIAIYLSPFLRENPVIGVRPGRWKVRLHGIEVRDGRYHGWIERDDPRPIDITPERNLWSFPSFFSETSNVDNSSVSSLACGHRVISVANLDTDGEKMAISSSQGPTRDGRPKPDVAAPGTDIVAANGFAGPDDGQWIAMTGTSMASPLVAGVVGLMLQAEPRLTAAQIRGIIQRTSQPLPGDTFEWENDSGFGALQPELCVQEAKILSKRVKLNP